METNKMATIGLLGGMSFQSTKEYYTLINEGVNKIKGSHHTAEILISSVNFDNIEQCIKTGKWEEAGAYLASKAKSLELGGADVIFLCTNTMHKVREIIKSSITVPFVDIIEVTALEVLKQNLKTVGLLGTYPTMTDAFFRENYKKYNLNIITPPEEDKIKMNKIIFEEMCHNKFLPESKDYYLKVIQKLKDNGAQGIILGCTEIKMLINQKDFDEQFLIFDTTELHCNKAINISVNGLDNKVF